MAVNLGIAYKVTDRLERVWGSVTLNTKFNGAFHGWLQAGPAFREIEPVFRALDRFVAAKDGVEDCVCEITKLGVLLSSENGRAELAGIVYVSESKLFSCDP